MSLYSHVSFPRCPLSFILSYYFKKYKMSFLDLLKLTVSSFSFRTSSEEMSLFVNLILRGYFGRHCRSPLRYRDHPKYNSHFSGLSFLSSHLTSSSSVLTDISCSLNYYLVEMLTSSLHYLSLLFKSLDHNKCSYSVLFFSFSLLFSSIYFRSFLMIFSS